MTDSNGTVAGQGTLPAAMLGDEPTDRVYDSYSDRDDNSSIAPFPPYRERDDSGDDRDLPQEGVEQAVDACRPVGVEADSEAQSDSLPTPTPPAAGDSTSAGRVRLFSDAAHPRSPTTTSADSAEPEMQAEAPAKAPSPQPAPPPPYWKHSRDASSSKHATNTLPQEDRPQPQNGARHAEHPENREHREHTEYTEHSEHSAASSAVAVVPPKQKQKQKTKPKGLFLFSRPTASRPPPSSSANPKSSVSSPGPQSHRRDTSSSTLDFHANQITLQDNEAAEGTAAYSESIISPASQLSSTSTVVSNASSASNASSRKSSSNAWLFGLDAPDIPPPQASTTAHPGPASGTSTQSKANRCWARRVDIVDHVVVNGGSGGGSHPRIGAFVVWTVRVETLGPAVPPSCSLQPSPSPTAAPSTSPAGTTFTIYKRYSEFDTLRRRLVASFPQARGGGALPPLPPKSVLGKFKPSFLEQRRLGLQYFLNCILLNPEFAGSPVLQEFLFD